MVTDDDSVSLSGNPFTFKEFHYFVSGLAMGFISGIIVGMFVLLEALK